MFNWLKRILGADDVVRLIPAEIHGEWYAMDADNGLRYGGPYKRKADARGVITRLVKKNESYRRA